MILPRGKQHRSGKPPIRAKLASISASCVKASAIVDAVTIAMATKRSRGGNQVIHLKRAPERQIKRAYPHCFQRIGECLVTLGCGIARSTSSARFPSANRSQPARRARSSCFQTRISGNTKLRSESPRSRSGSANTAQSSSTSLVLAPQPLPMAADVPASGLHAQEPPGEQPAPLLAWALFRAGLQALPARAFRGQVFAPAASAAPRPPSAPADTPAR